MGTIDIITKEIKTTMEEFSDGTCYCPINDKGEFVEDKIEAILKSYSVRDYSIDIDWLLDPPGLEVGYCSIAWVDNSTKKLQHITCGLYLM